MKEILFYVKPDSETPIFTLKIPTFKPSTHIYNVCAEFNSTNYRLTDLFDDIPHMSLLNMGNTTSQYYIATLKLFTDAGWMPRNVAPYNDIQTMLSNSSDVNFDTYPGNPNIIQLYTKHKWKFCFYKTNNRDYYLISPTNTMYSMSYTLCTSNTGLIICNLAMSDNKAVPLVSQVNYWLENVWTFVCVKDNPTIWDLVYQADGTDVPPEDTDPFAPGGNTPSEPTGGGGTFDESSDPIDFPPLPTISASDTGFMQVFNPTYSQLRELTSYLWSDLFDLATYKKLFADPMDCILGLSIVPVQPVVAGTTELTVGNIPTGLTFNYVSSQFISVDCGSVELKEYWGSYLDYAPYTKVHIALPYVGIHPLNTDDCMGKKIYLRYHVDIVTGAVIAFIKCGDKLLYEFTGQCAMEVPITQASWSSAIGNAIGAAASLGAMAATGGLSAPITAAQAAAGASAIASNVLASKPSVEKSGAISGTGGFLGIQTPYLIIERPRQALPKNQNTYMGYPAFDTVKLKDMKGYTKIAHIHVTEVPATANEIAEIENLLKEGVIF